MLSVSALADPTRRRIVELLAKEEYTAGEIVEEFDLSAPAISQHLKVLRDAGLLRVRVEGQRRVHSLVPEGFAELDGWLHHLKRTWSDRKEWVAEATPARPAVTGKSVRAPKPPPPPPPRADDGWEIIKMENP